MLSPQPKHTPELEKPQLHRNKYSNAHTDALTPTQTHSRNTPTYHSPCRFSISITKRHGKPKRSTLIAWVQSKKHEEGPEEGPSNSVDDPRS